MVFHSFNLFRTDRADNCTLAPILGAAISRRSRRGGRDEISRSRVKIRIRPIKVFRQNVRAATAIVVRARARSADISPRSCCSYEPPRLLTLRMVKDG